MNKLQSEKYVVESPMSFSGSAKRLWRANGNMVYRLSMLFIIPMIWCVIAMWYALFGLLLIPYRILRRGQRKRKLQEIRHRELLSK